MRSDGPRSRFPAPTSPGDHVRAMLLVVGAAILAGIVLRLSGFVGGAYSWFLLSGAGDDSWMPMRLAYERATGAAPGTLSDLFLVDRVKFQYPPTSLLLYAGLDWAGIEPTDRAMNALVWLSILATAPLVFGVCRAYMAAERARLGFTGRQELLVAGAFGAAALFFYPIMICWRLGQVQGLLNMLFAAACLCWLADRRALAGALIGLTCLVKPQFSLFLLWAALRRERGFAAGQAVVLAAGGLASVALFGWRPHLEYLDVLSFITRHGEAFWDNTSMNGVANRLLYPDQSLLFHYNDWPDFSPAVYLATLAWSAAITAVALFAASRLGERRSVFDLMGAAFCFTFAAPIAWGHHFGIAMPLFALLLIAIGADRRRGAAFVLASVCYLAFSENWNVSDLLAGTPFALLQSWRFFAAIAVLCLLYRAAPGTVLVGVAAGLGLGPRKLAAGGDRP